MVSKKGEKRATVYKALKQRGPKAQKYSRWGIGCGWPIS